VSPDPDPSRPPWGTRLLGMYVEPPPHRKRRVQRVLTQMLLLTHGLGVLGVLTVLGLLLPFDELVSGRFRPAALVVTPVAVVAGFAVGLWWLTRVVTRWLRWPEENRPPTPEEQQLCLAAPLKITLRTGVLWAVGGGAVVAAYAAEDLAALPIVAAAVVVVGSLSCGSAYIVSEVALRPLSALALEAGPVENSPLIGIQGRVQAFWVVSNGLPVLGLVLIAVYAVTSRDLSVVRLVSVVVVLGAGALVVGFGATWLLATAMLAPVRQVHWAMEDLAGGDLDTRVDVFDGTELGQLQRGFNEMADMVRERQRIRELFVRHVGSQVARAAEVQEPRLGGDAAVVGVLFVDLIGSTRLASTRPAGEVVETLNAFFEVVVERVEAHGGLLDKFQGDAALAVFGAPAPLADPATAVLAAARDLAAALPDLVPDCAAGIGVSYGEVVAGYVGSATRFEYTVIGDAVNEAARLCELAKAHPLRVLASAAALEAATVAESGRWTIGGSVELRGRAAPTTLAWPIG